jgi:bacterioferritin
MQGNPEVMEFLNETLKAELTAINQYFLHAKMCENWGYGRLAEYHFKESVEEMRHAEDLIRRILYFEGTPNMTELFSIRVGRDVKTQMENDLAMEMAAVERLNKAVAKALAVGDNGSRDLFNKILVNEEAHIDWLEAQLHLIGQVGAENYLAQQIHGSGGGAGH